MIFFFFQAEDGIRDWSVTGVQTCALPICRNEGRTVLFGRILFCREFEQRRGYDLQTKLSSLHFCSLHPSSQDISFETQHLPQPALHRQSVFPALNEPLLQKPVAGTSRYCIFLPAYP